MVNKELKFGTDAKASIREGIDILANAVKTTLGPQGNLVVIGKWDNGLPHVTKDGVTVAKSIQFKNEYMDAGANLIREAALKQLSVGDGTTTTTVIAQAMIHEIDKQLKNGRNSAMIKRELLNSKPTVINLIKDFAKQITSNDELRRVATISANNDSEIGDLIADAIEKIGRDGVITVDESSNVNTMIDVIKGMQFDKGYMSQHFVTDLEKDQCILEKPYILITNQKVNSMKSVANILNEIIGENRSILIIADDFDSEVIETLKLNKLQGIIKVCLVKAPSFGVYRDSVLEDIAVLTNGTCVSYESGIELRDITTVHLGTCEKVIINKETTTIVNGAGSEENVKLREDQIRNQLKEQVFGLDGDFMTDFLKRRLAKLTGGIAVIHVGGTTELEMKERKDRIDDAVAATMAAIEEGIVPGGGVVFKDMIDDPFIDEITAAGLEAPIVQLFSNANIVKAYSLKPGFGFDLLKNGEECNMFEKGIIDPAKTARMAYENALSVALLYLMTNCVIVPEETPNLITI